MARRSKRTYTVECKPWGSHGDESLKLRDWYGAEYCRRFKYNGNCGCGGNSRNNKKLSHHGHYMRYSYRLLRRAKARRRRGIPEPLD